MKLLALLAIPALALAKDDASWSKAALGDLAAARRVLEANHPGPVDDENPEFRRWLDEGYDAAKEKASKASTAEGYIAALRLFVNGFRDGHLNFWPKTDRAAPRWPGFVVALREGRFLVRRFGEGGEPPEGARLVSCDGRTPDRMMREDVFPYLFGDDRLEASWTSMAPTLLVDASNPFVTRSSACVFDAAGSTRAYELAWRELDGEALEEKRRLAAFGPPPGLALRPVAGGLWASVPTFDPRRDEKAAMTAVLDGLAAAGDARLVVFDLRGNQGGSSQWGEELLTRVLGAEAARTLAARVAAGEKVDWRASRGNLEHLRSLLPKLREAFGPASEAVRSVEAVVSGLELALREGATFYREASAPASPPPRPTSNGPRLVFVTDGLCGSACLDFADLLLEAGALHVGGPTYADTSYMELRLESLPSGFGKLAFAIKAYRGRKRASGQPYVPKHRWTGDFSDTVGLERWVLGLAGAAGSPGSGVP